MRNDFYLESSKPGKLNSHMDKRGFTKATASLNEDMLKGLQLAKQQGKARFLGISNHGNQVEMIDAAIESKMYQVLLLGYNFRQDSILKPALERANKAGLGRITACICP